MKVLYIGTADIAGGAALLAHSLAESLFSKYGVETQFLVSEKFSDKKNVIATRSKPVWFFEKSFDKFLNLLGFQYYFIPISSAKILKETKKYYPDIIHLNNIHGGYFQTDLLTKLAEIAPIVWTFHDMFPITGHCAYSFECEKWMTGCGNCERLDIYPLIKKDRTNALWNYKNKVFNSADFTIVTPSLWLKKCIEQSFLKNKDIRLIYNGIDLNEFKKINKQKARKELALPLDKKIVLFSANGGVKNPFKGGDFVFQSFEKLKNRNDILFLNIGGNNDRTSENWLDFGYVKDPQIMAKLYPAADVYLFPTLADNCPLTAIESLACGLPVVTFETGGVPEIFENDKTGLIVGYKNGAMLTSALEKLLDDDELREKMSENAVEASKKFSKEKMTEEYFRIYKEIVKDNAIVK